MWDEQAAKQSVAHCASRLAGLAEDIEIEGLGRQWRGVARDACARNLRDLEADLRRLASDCRSLVGGLPLYPLW